MKAEIIEFNKNTPIHGHQYAFIVTDTYGLCELLEIPDGTNIINIFGYTGCLVDKEEVLRFVDRHKEDSIIITTACASTIEFPEDKYMLPNDDVSHEQSDSIVDNGKEIIPIKEVLDREVEMLESCGFKDFNFYVKYNTARAMIYGNDLGIAIINKAREFERAEKE